MLPSVEVKETTAAKKASSGFKFDANQQFQLDAINSVVDLFDGQPQDAEKLVLALQGNRNPVFSGQGQLEIAGTQGTLDMDLSYEVGAIGNNLIIDNDLILDNLRRVQDRNGLEVSDQLHDPKHLDFDVEMETGTGKTYVYLRTIFELAKKYNFTKFIILVPSVAIREGVNTSIRLMREHFDNLYKPYGITFDSGVYSGKNPEEVQSFATSTNVQIMVMTIAAIRGTANTRVIHQNRDKLGGLKPIDYLRATRPIVIMDEPQNMESELSTSALKDLNPAFTLRYSATHRKRRNVVYRLDPVDAHQLGLVKEIVVADARQEGADAKPYIKVVSVTRDPWLAKLELACRTADGTIKRKEVKVKPGQELSDPRITGTPASDMPGNSAYEGWRINGLSIDPPSVEFTWGTLKEGETIGGSSDVVFKEMIRETIREHLHKAVLLKDAKIKVLSLFFVDKVASYLGEGTTNETANGDFARWFDEVFLEERAKNPAAAAMMPEDPRELRRAYFSQIRKGVFGDTTGATTKDDDSYDLIMRDKEKLLDESQPVRFIFSHSALREGWDNPNVFQICTLREMGSETELRQTLGRGLRLPVARTPSGYERISDKSVASLTVIAQDSYQDYAARLQNEYREAGIEIGSVRKNEFSQIPLHDDDLVDTDIMTGDINTDPMFGYERSAAVHDHLLRKGFIDVKRKLLPKFQPNTLGFSLDLPPEFEAYEPEIIEKLGAINIGNFVKSKSGRRTRVLNKQLYHTEAFEEFWDTIAQRTTYRVTVDRDVLIANCIAAIKAAPAVEPLRIQVTRAAVKVLRGGTKGSELGTRSEELKGSYELPDIVSELTRATELTRRTVIEILIGSGRLKEFIANPNDVITLMKKHIQIELARLVVEGIQYEKIGGYVYELRELQRDGLEEKDYFLDNLYQVKNQEKTDFNYVVFDSGPEREFAELLDSREDVKLFLKLPPRFQIDTPVGPYNPDWAIIKTENGEDRIYLIRETKDTMDAHLRRPKENAKIVAAKKHFEAIGVPNYKVSAPNHWNL